MDLSDDGIRQQRESCDSRNDNNGDIPMDEIIPREDVTNRENDRSNQLKYINCLYEPIREADLTLDYPIYFFRRSLFSNHARYRDCILDDREDYDPDWNVGSPSQVSQLGFDCIDIFLLIFGICTFLADVIFDIVVAVSHYNDGNTYYFTLTVIFVVTPTIIMTSISLRWYVIDTKERESPTISTLQWTFRALLLLLQLGPVMRYFESLHYGFQYRKYISENNPRLARKYYQYMIYYASDACMLRMFESFMEAAPQLVLQTYILALQPDKTFDGTVALQCFSIITSLISISWCLASYPQMFVAGKNKSYLEKLDKSILEKVVEFLWRFCMLVSRAMALALFASKFGHLILWIVAGHWLVMFVWFRKMKVGWPWDCYKKWGRNRLLMHPWIYHRPNVHEELAYDSLIAITFIFCYFGPRDVKPTKGQYAFYYSFMFIENSILIFMWFQACDPLTWFRVPAFAGCFVAFFCGLIFMITYYLHFNPTKAIEVLQTPIQKPLESRSPKVTSTISAFSLEETALQPVKGNGLCSIN